MKSSKKISTRSKSAYLRKHKKLITSLAIATLILSIGSLAFIYNNSNPSNAQIAEKQRSNSEASLDASLKSKSDTKIVDAKSQSQDGETTTSDTTPTMGSTPSGCVGCETKNPRFSINATGTNITLSPDSNSATYTASASDGRYLSWSGPEGGTSKVFGLTNGSTEGKSYQYYVRAESGAAAGTYSMVITGLDPKTSTVVRKTITVKVQAQPTYSLSSQALVEDKTSNSAIISVKINRYSGHTNTVYGSGKLQCPSKASISSPTANTSDVYLYLTFSGSIGLGSACTLTVTTYDNAGNSDSRSYSIGL